MKRPKTTKADYEPLEWVIYYALYSVLSSCDIYHPMRALPLWDKGTEDTIYWCLGKLTFLDSKLLEDISAWALKAIELNNEKPKVRKSINEAIAKLQRQTEIILEKRGERE